MVYCLLTWPFRKVCYMEVVPCTSTCSLLTFPLISPILDLAFDHIFSWVLVLSCSLLYQQLSSHPTAVGFLERTIQNVPSHILGQMPTSSPWHSMLNHKSPATGSSAQVESIHQAHRYAFHSMYYSSYKRIYRFGIRCIITIAVVQVCPLTWFIWDACTKQ